MTDKKKYGMVISVRGRCPGQNKQTCGLVSKPDRKMSLQKIIAIEKNFKKREIDFDLHFSGLSKSAYFYFDNKDGQTVILRISNHDLPAKYETRANRHTDFSFTDKMGDIMAFVEKETGKKAVRKSRDTVLVSAKDREYLEKEARALDITFERVVEIYFSGKKVVFEKAGK